MNSTQLVGATDLFVLLERAFRNRTRNCTACVFTLPFHIAAGPGHPNWSVIPSAACSEPCRGELEDLVAQYQAAYRLADPRIA
jgi:hypothetical protein